MLEYKPLKEWLLEMKFSSLDENFIIGIWWVKSIWRWHQLWPASCKPLLMLWLIKLLKSFGFIKNLANPQKTCKDLNADSFDPYETLLLPLCPSQNNVHHTVKLVSGFFCSNTKDAGFLCTRVSRFCWSFNQIGKMHDLFN